MQGQEQGTGHGRAPRLGVLVQDVNAAAALRLMEQGGAVQSRSRARMLWFRAVWRWASVSGSCWIGVSMASIGIHRRRSRGRGRAPSAGVSYEGWRRLSSGLLAPSHRYSGFPSGTSLGRMCSSSPRMAAIRLRSRIITMAPWANRAVRDRPFFQRSRSTSGSAGTWVTEAGYYWQ